MEYNKTELKKYNYLIGQKIKAIRDLKGFKQDYVAEKLGISSGHYSNLENGHKTCTLYILIRLCQILDTTPNELLEGCLSSLISLPLTYTSFVPVPFSTINNGF